MSTRPPAADWATDFDHLDPPLGRKPLPHLGTTLKQKRPIAHTDRFMGASFPSRYEDVRTIAYDTEHFSSRRIIVREVRPPLIPAPDYFCGAGRRQRPLKVRWWQGRGCSQAHQPIRTDVRFSRKSQ
jgi:hypothetical protein